MNFDIDNAKLFEEDKLPAINKEFLDSIYTEKKTVIQETFQLPGGSCVSSTRCSTYSHDELFEFLRAMFAIDGLASVKHFLLEYGKIGLFPKFIKYAQRFDKEVSKFKGTCSETGHPVTTSDCCKVDNKYYHCYNCASFKEEAQKPINGICDLYGHITNSHGSCVTKKGRCSCNNCSYFFPGD